MGASSRRDIWVQGARPRTLPAAIAPVLVGAGASVGVGATDVVWANALFALVVSLALQVGVNYANDYSDGIRGTDAQRVGPMRLVGSGVVPARQVKMAAFISFGVACIAGLLIAATTSWWLLLVGAVCIAAAWGYTGGPKPYGYLGLGELFVFLFFGVIATTGTTYAITQQLTRLSLICSVAVGALACALLVVNNLRDIPGDTQAGKITLAVKLGDRTTRGVYVALIGLAALAIAVVAFDRPPAITGLVGLIAALPAIREIRRGASGKHLIPVLGATGRAQLIVAILLTAGLIIG